MDKYIEEIKNFIEQFKLQIMIALSIVIVLLSLYCFWAKPTSTIKADHNNALKVKPKFNNSHKQQNNNQIYVDVKGAVKNPGVYQVTKAMRVLDAIKLAGGYNEFADEKHINLAKKVNDQEIIYVPIHGEIEGIPTNDGIGSNSNNQDEKASGTKININDADINKIKSVNGIGDKKAQKIVDYRNDHGVFKRVDDLKNVSGFGEKTVSHLKDSLTV